MEFFVGILPEDKSRLVDFLIDIGVSIKNEYDDPHGYYIYVIDGTWEQYNLLMAETDNSFVRSLEHFEE